MFVAVLAGLLVLGALLLVALGALGKSRYQALYETEKEALLARSRAAKPALIDAQAIESLPPAVRKYLAAAGVVAGKPGLKNAVLEQTGGLRTAADKAWIPFESKQVYSMDPPGFVWVAEAHAAPLASLWARDKFVDAKGNMLIRILGLFTVADAKGPEMDLGAGLRHWGELISFPEMALSPYMKWEDLGERQARMRVEQDGLKMEAVVDFDAQGLPAAFHAKRFRDVNGKGVLTDWSGYTTGWKVIDGRLFPAHWESVWHLAEGDFPAVKMDVVSVRTE